MPIYEFLCPDCGERFERLLPVSGKSSRAVCPRCGSKGARKVYSSFGVGKAPASDTGSCPTGTCPTGTCGLPPL